MASGLNAAVGNYLLATSVGSAWSGPARSASVTVGGIKLTADTSAFAAVNLSANADTLRSLARFLNEFKPEEIANRPFVPSFARAEIRAANAVPPTTPVQSTPVQSTSPRPFEPPPPAPGTDPGPDPDLTALSRYTSPAANGLGTVITAVRGVSRFQSGSVDNALATFGAASAPTPDIDTKTQLKAMSQTALVNGYELAHLTSRLKADGSAPGLSDVERSASRANETVSGRDIRSISTGSGSDNVTVSNVWNVSLGDGNNRANVTDGAMIDAGKGNDIVVALRAGHIDAGDGTNDLTVENVGVVRAGGGDDTIRALNAGHIVAGDGKNTIQATGVGDIYAGADDDRITAIAAQKIDAGNGNNQINAIGVGKIFAGAGNDLIAANYSDDIDAGAGDNAIAAANVGNVTAGAGDDVLAADGAGNIDLGDGNNIAQLTDVGAVRTGQGADRIVATNATSVDSGAGADEIDAENVASVLAGVGNDRLTLKNATALYRRNDGTDTVYAKAGSAVDFDAISSADVTLIQIADAQNRIVAFDVQLKDGSGGVRIELQSGGDDAYVRFADGSRLSFADAQAAANALANP